MMRPPFTTTMIPFTAFFIDDLCVDEAVRGQHIGEALVKDSLEQGRRLGFRALQFNAVVATNARALHLYDKLGFVRLGTIPAIYEMPDGSFQDIILFYHLL